MSKKDPEVGDEIGEISASGKVNFEWKIFKFFSLSKDNDSYYCSHDFYYLDYEWYLEIHPNVCSTDDTDGLIGLFLVRRDDDRPKTVKIKLGIKKMNGKVKFLCDENSHTFTTDDQKSKGQFLKRCELLKRQSVLAPSDTLTVTCTMWSPEQHSMEDSLLERLSNLSRSLKNILDEGESTDVVLKTKSREIPAHRAILKSRSSVFKKMLDSDMRENQSGVIELPDEDEEAFDVVLSYMYCGEPEKMDAENVCEVYRIAHKYHLWELKKLCCVFIRNNISLDLACDLITMVYLYEEKELIECTKDYVVKNVARIVETEKWKELKKENSVVLSELLETILVENLPKIFKEV